MDRKLVPDRWETERLLITNSTVDDIDVLQQLHSLEFEYFLNLGGEKKYDPGYVRRCFEEGFELPPGGEKEYQKAQSVILKGTDKIIGNIDIYHGFPERNVLYIGLLFIHPHYRKSGLGQELEKGICEKAWEAAYSSIKLGVLLKNWPALRFWTQCGFNRIYKISGDKEYSKDGRAMIGLEKLLTC